MTINTKDEQIVRSYLLGRLNEAEREELELRLFTDKDLCSTVDLIRDELSDEYVFDDLSEDERSSLAALTRMQPERTKNVYFADTLRKYSTRQTETEVVKESPGLFAALFSVHRRITFAFSAVFVALVGATLFLYLGGSAGTEIPQTSTEHSAIQETVDANKKETPATENSVIENKIEEPSVSEKPRPLKEKLAKPSVATFVLAPGLVRDGGQTQITLSSTLRSINLQPILLQDSYPRYTTKLTTTDGRSVSTFKSLTARKATNGTTLNVLVPAQLLHKADYVLKVSGITTEGNAEDVATYYFRVNK